MLNLEQLKLGHISRRRREGADPQTIIHELIGMGIPEEEAYETVGQVIVSMPVQRSYDGWWIWLSIPLLLGTGALVYYALTHGFEATLGMMAYAAAGMAILGMGMLGLFLASRFKMRWGYTRHYFQYEEEQSDSPNYFLWTGAVVFTIGVALFMLIGLTHPDLIKSLFRS